MRTKAIQLLCLCALSLVAASTWAQAPASPDDTAAQAARTREATGEAPPSAPTPTIVPVEPPSLIPPNDLPGPGASSLPQPPVSPEIQLLNALFKQSSLGHAADDNRLHEQTAELETHIRNDEDLHRLKDAALRAPTDLERRHRLKTYYQSYYAKLRARATTPELIAYIKFQATAHESILLQPRVRHETDEAKSTTPAQTNVVPLRRPAQAKVNNIFH
ncbi:MAG: hypothetical protein H0X40_01845 [Chthoniobacterales bacterium]|nr:hypothetical protein [Chthoniobacterales bacterium]